MASDEPPLEVRQAAQRALKLAQRREPVLELATEVDNIDKGDKAGPAKSSPGGLEWHFEGQDCRATLELLPVAAGWTGTVLIEGEDGFQVTVYRSEQKLRPRKASSGRAELGLLVAGPLSLTLTLTDGRSMQTSWVTLPRPPKARLSR